MAEQGPRPDIKRQAIIIIHGVGEQRPMDTLRGFADAVLGAKPEDKEIYYYSKPDRISEEFDLRRLRSAKGKVQTDFYESYWAHRMPIATWGRMGEWLRLLLWRQRGDVPKKVMWLWRAGWAAMLTFVLFFFITTIFFLCPSLRPSWWTTTLALPLGLAIILGIIDYVLLSVIGDAAVYLSASPRNVAARNDIRRAGVDLIERLHQDGRYDRITVAGHSLGSVIGYDILCHAWQRLHATHGKPSWPNGDPMKSAEKAAVAFQRVDSTPAVQEAQTAWRVATTDLWREQRRQGFRWLVTDFVTMGCPLAHADILLARDRMKFETRKRDRELPTCPPELEKGRFSYEHRYLTTARSKRSLRMLHHGALFAVTRWTNLYFPSNKLRGDFVGGPLAPVLGLGVKDVAVRTAKWGGWFSHTFYWDRDRRDEGRADAPVPNLIAALDLNAVGPMGKGRKDGPSPAPGPSH